MLDRAAACLHPGAMFSAIALFSLGCVGEASATYRGVLTAGSSAGHEFVDLPPRPTGPETPADPLAKSQLGTAGARIADARIIMHVAHLSEGSSLPQSPCAADRWIPRDAGREPKHPWPVTSEDQVYEDGYTDAEGRFGVSQIFGGMLGLNAYISLCVLHPDYETYVYSAIFEETPDPKHGQRLLHVVIPPKSHGGAKQSGDLDPSDGPFTQL